MGASVVQVRLTTPWEEPEQTSPALALQPFGLGTYSSSLLLIFLFLFVCLFCFAL